RGVIARGQTNSNMLTTTGSINLSGNYGDPARENLAKSLPDIARLIAAPGSTSRVFYTGIGDFDTHGYEEQPGVAAAKPTLTERLDSVMMAISAFVQDLKSSAINHWNDTAIVIYTEFGRRNLENQTFGTDHGHGFHMFVLGGQVLGGLKGSPVNASDLAAENLPQDIDYRTVFKVILDDWLQVNGAAVFDDFTAPANPPQLF
ncbi:MAG: DUF1501 domain-containing protein, partial [Salinibacterium sp.]|nr:DUF1501 domain-containing protein [Salinibacterium sp.]